MISQLKNANTSFSSCNDVDSIFKQLIDNDETSVIAQLFTSEQFIKLWKNYYFQISMKVDMAIKDGNYKNVSELIAKQDLLIIQKDAVQNLKCCNAA